MGGWISLWGKGFYGGFFRGEGGFPRVNLSGKALQRGNLHGSYKKYFFMSCFLFSFPFLRVDM